VNSSTQNKYEVKVHELEENGKIILKASLLIQAAKCNQLRRRCMSRNENASSENKNAPFEIVISVPVPKWNKATELASLLLTCAYIPRKKSGTLLTRLLLNSIIGSRCGL
jgi:hypothetical protein